MVSKNNNNKAVLAALALMLLSFSVASLLAISTPHYARAQGDTVEGGGNATNATTTTGAAAGNATNATTTTGAAGNATNATTTTGAAGNATNATSTGDGETAAGTQIGGPLSLYGGGGGGQ
jgi:hypothetical protein